MKRRISLILASLTLVIPFVFTGCQDSTVSEDSQTAADAKTEAQTTEQLQADTAAQTSEETTTESGPQPVKTLTPDNMSEWVKFNGRTYTDTTDSSIHFDWSLGGFEVNFTGTGIKAELVTSLGDNADRNTMVYVYIDGSDTSSKTIWLNEKKAEYVLAENLAEGAHSLKLVKRNSVAYASAGVTKIEVLGSESAQFTEKPARKSRLIEFIGDSITCGDGDLAPNGRMEYVSECQDATCAYAYFTAQAFDADVSIVAKGGAGLVWTSGKTAEEGGATIPSVYDYACKYNSDVKWDFTENQPDLIVINLGTNDRNLIYPSGTTADAANKEKFTTAYYNFIKHLRELNPDVPIVCTFGQMIDYSKYDLGIGDVVDKLTSEGYKDIVYVKVPKATSTGVGGHPLTSAQRSAAKFYLVPAIQKLIPGWAS